MDAIDILVSQGHAHWEQGDQLILVAADGVEVTLGTATGKYRAITLAYLAEHPTPDTW